jgi:hypothetical protein
LHTVTTRAHSGLRLPVINRVYRPTSLDLECRPYEFGWLYFAWLATLDAPARTQPASQATTDHKGR